MSNKIIPDRDIAEVILEAGGTDALKCYQCGMCMAVCPWYHVTAVDFPVYQIPQSVRLGAMIASEEAEEIEREVTEVYRCVGCEACLDQCPHSIDLPKVMRSIRRILVEYDSYPTDLKDSVSRIQSFGNPFGEPREKRSKFTQELGVPTFETDMDYLLFRCCVTTYDPVGNRAAQGLINALQKAKVSIGVLGDEESCCCESVRRAGAEDVFQEVAQGNIAAFKNAGASKILTISPHCHTTFVREYSEFSEDFEYLHYTQLLARLIEEKKLSPKKALGKKIVYHDPCTLGRQNLIYEEPRNILRSIPELELLEIPYFNKENSLCCGGGSGGVWLERPKEERMSDIRVQQAIDTGAEIIAVACPYCYQMFEDSVKTMGVDLEIRDVAELLANSL
jgi:Fe-S oxidoreductase